MVIVTAGTALCWWHIDSTPHSVALTTFLYYVLPLTFLLFIYFFTTQLLHPTQETSEELPLDKPDSIKKHSSKKSSSTGRTVPSNKTFSGDRRIPNKKSSSNNRTVPIKKSSSDDKPVPSKKSSSSNGTVPIKKSSSNDKPVPSKKSKKDKGK